MALANKIDPAQAQSALEGWLSDHIEDVDKVEVSDVAIPTVSGYSCETVLFTASWVHQRTTHRQALVARVAPAMGSMAVFPSYDLDREALIMRTLAAHTAVPAPSVLFGENDPSVLGGPFIIMRRVDGNIPADDPPYALEGWVVDLAPLAQRRLVEQAVDTLVQLAHVDWRRLGLGAIGRIGLTEQLAYLQHLYDDGAQDRPHSTIEAGLHWLFEHAPRDERLVLCWGDARLGNFVFSEDLSVSGTLDWEVASVGSPEVDISYFLYTLRVWSEGFGVPSPAGFPGRSEILARFERQSGFRLSVVEYYERYAAVFGAIMAMRAGKVMIQAGQLPPDSTMPVINPASVALADYLGIPAPAGEIADWTGKR